MTVSSSHSLRTPYLIINKAIQLKTKERRKMKKKKTQRSQCHNSNQAHLMPSMDSAKVLVDWLRRDKAEKEPAKIGDLRVSRYFEQNTGMSYHFIKEGASSWHVCNATIGPTIGFPPWPKWCPIGLSNGNLSSLDYLSFDPWSGPPLAHYNEWSRGSCGANLGLQING